MSLIETHNRRALMLEERINTLLAHPDFLLLYIPGGSAKMKLVKPSIDVYHRERIMRRMKLVKPSNDLQRIHGDVDIHSTWYVLSHLWGTSKTDPQLWSEIGLYVDDEHGRAAEPIPMRHEKRSTLLQLLASYPDSYWWIDVLCARTDTPLDIMGTIYACCTLCVAMIDCDPRLIQHINSYPVALQPQMAGDIHALTECTWWNRVWTWQEIVLPQKVALIAETTTDFSSHGYVDAEYLITFWGTSTTALREVNLGRSLKNLASFNLDNAGPPGVPLGIMCDLYTFFYILGKSSRRCMDPVDYVYGVLGVLQLDIPRMTDPDTVWQTFLSQLEKLIIRIKSPLNPKKRSNTTVDARAWNVDLKTAQSMADVYRYIAPMH